MASRDVKEELHGYLRAERETLVWKLDGLGEYDVPRPLTPSGTNLLGLVKHSTATHLGYFGQVFGRSTRELEALVPDVEGPAADFWASPDESARDVVDRHREACAFADVTTGDLPLDATGQVWWWGDDPVTLQHIIVHVTADTQRHAGHADNLHLRNVAERRRFRERVEAAAAVFR